MPSPGPARMPKSVGPRGTAVRAQNRRKSFSPRRLAYGLCKFAKAAKHERFRYGIVLWWGFFGERFLGTYVERTPRPTARRAGDPNVWHQGC